MKIPPTVDTRFLLTTFLEESAPIQEKVKRKARELREAGAYVPTIVLHEVFKFEYETQGAEIANHRANAIVQSTFQVVPLDARIALSSAELRCRHRGLPTADSIIAATALALKSNIVVTDDPHFEQIRGLRAEWI